MITRAKARITKPQKYFGCLTQLHPSPNWSQLEPTLYDEAASLAVWRQAMDSEFQALQLNHTWDLSHLLPLKTL